MSTSLEDVAASLQWFYHSRKVLVLLMNCEESSKLFQMCHHLYLNQSEFSLSNVMILLAVLILAATSIDLLVLLTLSLSFFVQFCSAQSDVVLIDTGTLLQTRGMIE